MHLINTQYLSYKCTKLYLKCNSVPWGHKITFLGVNLSAQLAKFPVWIEDVHRSELSGHVIWQNIPFIPGEGQNCDPKGDHQQADQHHLDSWCRSHEGTWSMSGICSASQCNPQPYAKVQGAVQRRQTSSDPGAPTLGNLRRHLGQALPSWRQTKILG